MPLDGAGSAAFVVFEDAGSAWGGGDTGECELGSEAGAGASGVAAVEAFSRRFWIFSL